MLREVASLEPLAAEVFHQRARFWIEQHAMDLGAQNFGGAQAMIARELEQLVVGQAAPEEIGKARGELEVVKVASWLNAEQEAGRNEDGFEGELHAMVEGIAVLPRGLDKTDEPVEFVVGDRPAVGPARQVREIRANAGQGVMPGRVAAAKNSGVAFGKRRRRGVVRSADFDVTQTCAGGRHFYRKLWIPSTEVHAELHGAQAFGSVFDGEAFGRDAVDPQFGVDRITLM